MDTPEPQSPEVEHQFHRYVTHRIPWYVHVLWVLFWILAVSYILIYQFPIIKGEFLSPP